MSHEPAPTKRTSLPHAIITLGWVSFFTDVASEMVYPVVPLFLVAVLGAPATVLGAMEGAAEAVVCLMKGASGWHSDRIGRRTPFVRAGYGLGALSKPLLAMAFSWPMVFIARIIDRSGKGLRTTARDAMIADAAPAAIAGRAYGFHRAMDTTGAIVGVLLSMGLLALLPGHYRTIFLLAALPGIVAVWLTFRLKEPDAAPAATAAPRLPLREALRGLPPAYWRALLLLSLFSLANSTDALLLLRTRDLGFSDTHVIGAYVLFNLVYAASAYPAGILSDRIGRWRLMLGGWTLYALTYFGFALSGPAGIWALFPIYGLYMGLTEGVGKAIIASGLPADRRGTAMGFFLMLTGLLSLAGNLAAGLAWDLIGPRAPFILGGALALLAVIVALALPRNHRHPAA
ncbi:major facilitator superfamily MFS_1 [Pseudodesulfovibrio mercurii]|uniref:Major facilitator superfamily MFS_1 n=1 Tax=Pseudodesulfovibrio mercurii TaxID=641491 RepID=F0JC32_9BACT|nr:MFS transporter [Pseudodesulfovibrio mercurii]EGB15605.1 major facilitator superfamily MFS_1 [Pseudodesulfovibrio mercurii]